MQLWKGRFSKEIDPKTNDFNSSIKFDSRMYKEDIDGSIAHATMLCTQGIISSDDLALIVEGLNNIKTEIEAGTLLIDPNAEDIHTFVEGELTSRIGAAGKRLHTARSRNDQVALDIRLYLRHECDDVLNQLTELIDVLCKKAEQYAGAVMPGYTHLQRAQPITFAHHLLAYAQMFIRDAGRLSDAVKRMNYSPLGSCALSGTTYDTDRFYEAEKLGFYGIMQNSIDGVSDRDFCVELMSAFSVIMMHLSRFSEEIILWSSWEFKFVELDDSYTTGSSIMPQKKNPDMAELVRGKTGRVYGDLFALLTSLKGLPLAYNKDMQEDKEAIFDSIETVEKCLSIFAPMVATMTVLKDNMYLAAQKGFINATDLADYLVKKGMPFRTAYKIVGQTVGECIEKNKVLETLTLDEYKAHSELFEEDLYHDISLETCIATRISAGSTGYESVKKQIEFVTEFINGKENIY